MKHSDFWKKVESDTTFRASVLADGDGSFLRSVGVPAEHVDALLARVAELRDIESGELDTQQLEAAAGGVGLGGLGGGELSQRAKSFFVANHTQMASYAGYDE